MLTTIREIPTLAEISRPEWDVSYLGMACTSPMDGCLGRRVNVHHAHASARARRAGAPRSAATVPLRRQ
jgi:hypothetical protein